MTYPELQNVDYVFYINNKTGRVHMANLSNKEEKDENNQPLYEGIYKNCLMLLQNQKITDKLYLMSENTFNKIKRDYWKADMYVINSFLEKHSDKIIERQVK